MRSRCHRVSNSVSSRGRILRHRRIRLRRRQSKASLGRPAWSGTGMRACHADSVVRRAPSPSPAREALYSCMRKRGKSLDFDRDLEPFGPELKAEGLVETACRRHKIAVAFFEPNSPHCREIDINLGCGHNPHWKLERELDVKT